MRYKYQTLFSEIGEKGQKELEKKTVTIVGVGGVGSAVAMFLARSGVNLRLVDKDRVYEDELQRQAIYTEDQINKFKAKEAKKNLERQNSRVKIKTFHEELVPTNSFLLDSDVVIDSTNDINTSLIIDKNCKKPLLVCRYAGDSGIVFNKTATINVKKLQAKLEKDKKIEDIGIFNPTVCLAASILVSESMKILLKKKPIKGLISFNSWNHTIRVKK